MIANFDIMNLVSNSDSHTSTFMTAHKVLLCIQWPVT
jgi:hypothetical protein